MVGLNSAGTALQTQLPTVAAWAASGVADSPPAFAAPGRCGALRGKHGRQPRARLSAASSGRLRRSWAEADAFAVHQLAEARIVVIEEAKAGLALASVRSPRTWNPMATSSNLANVPASLQAVGAASIPRSGARPRCWSAAAPTTSSSA